MDAEGRRNPVGVVVRFQQTTIGGKDMAPVPGRPTAARREVVHDDRVPGDREVSGIEEGATRPYGPPEPAFRIEDPHLPGAIIAVPEHRPGWQGGGADCGRVVSHLTGLVGSKVELTLEIEATIPDGAPEHVVRTVTENARTLRLKSQGFEEE